MDDDNTTNPGNAGVDERPRITVGLRDGTVVELRPISPEDRTLLIEGLRQLSMESRFARFGSGISSLSEAELRYLTEIDQVTHVAWGATVGGEPAGVGRYIVGQDGRADIAITVVDRFQHRGLGRLLFDALVASARASGVDSFSFSIEPWNRGVLRMLPGVDIELDEADGMLTGRLEIEDLPSDDLDTDFVEVLDRSRIRDAED
ncbi:MAG TPA: GNAT family N-acetyltransferase [Acidimicrobiia bacterium]